MKTVPSRAASLFERFILRLMMRGFDPEVVTFTSEDAYTVVPHALLALTATFSLAIMLLGRYSGHLLLAFAINALPASFGLAMSMYTEWGPEPRAGRMHLLKELTFWGTLLIVIVIYTALLLIVGDLI